MNRFLGIFAGLMACVCLSVFSPFLSATAPEGFFENFDGPGLDPQWLLFSSTGPRVYGYTSPPNHYSLTDNPGHLRYYLDPMTHFDGFLNNYQPTYGYHSCCSHDAGLEFHRLFSGENWVLEAKADFYMPYTNGRAFDLRIYFGDGGQDTYYVVIEYIRDVNQAHTRMMLVHQYGPTMAEYTRLEEISEIYDLYVPATMVKYFRAQREAGQITVQLSNDGVLWTDFFSRDLGAALDGKSQRLVLVGHSWFNTAGSYADWDYVKLTPVNQTVECILNLDPDTLNSKSKGKWITAYIQLPGEYNLDDIEINTLYLEYGTQKVLASRGENQGSVYMAKFDRQMVQNVLAGLTGDVVLKISGTVAGKILIGTDTIRVK